MGMKRFCAALLAVTMLLGCVPAAALAADGGGMTVTDEEGAALTVREEYIEVKQDDTTSTERVLCDDAGILYVPTSFVDRYTQYTYHPDRRDFSEYDTNDPDYRFAKVVMLPSGQNIAFLRAYPQPLEHVFTWDGELWLPAHQFLPLLEMYCGVEDGAFVLEVAGPSVADTFYGFDADDVYFDPAREFDGSAALEIISVTSAMWFDSFANFRLDRAIGLGNYEDYRTAVLDYVTDRDGYEEYLERILSDAAVTEHILDEAKTTQKNGKLIKKIVDVPLDLLRFWHDSLELQDQADGEGTWEIDQYFYKYIPEDVYDKISGTAKTAGYVMKGLDIAMNYALMVQDNVDMIAAVYPEVPQYVGGDIKLTALQSVFDSFSEISGGSMMTEAVSEVTTEAFQDALVDSALSLTSITSAELILAKLGGKLADLFFSKVSGVGAADDMALLNHHIILTCEAREAYGNAFTFGGAPYTGENIEKLRLCALMMLVASKRCYEILRDNNAHNEEYGSYCDTRIANIEQYIARMYELQYIQMYDGIEYFQAAPAMFQQNLQQARKNQAAGAEQLQQDLAAERPAFRLREKTQIGAVRYDATEEVKTYYTYDSNGWLVQEDSYVITEGESTFYESVTYTNDSMGRPVRTQSSQGAITEYRYDDAGRKRQEIDDNSAYAEWYGMSAYNVREYQYDENGRLARMLVWSADPEDAPDFVYDGVSAEYWVDYAYDANGVLVSDTSQGIYGGEPVVTYYDANGEKTSDGYGSTYVNEYDSYGNLLRQNQMVDYGSGPESYLDTYYVYEAADGQSASEGESGTAPDAGTEAVAAAEDLTAVTDPGVLSLADCLAMNYGGLSGLTWDSCDYTDSFDAPGQWFCICVRGGENYTFTFSGDQLGQAEACPVKASVFDTEYAGVEVTDGIYTGMTYGEICGLTELPAPVYDDGSVQFFSFAHSSFQTGDGHAVTLYFAGDDDAAVLSAADVSAVNG